jgi:hypothetical protein
MGDAAGKPVSLVPFVAADWAEIGGQRCDRDPALSEAPAFIGKALRASAGGEDRLD